MDRGKTSRRYCRHSGAGSGHKTRRRSKCAARYGISQGGEGSNGLNQNETWERMGMNRRVSTLTATHFTLFWRQQRWARPGGNLDPGDKKLGGNTGDWTTKTQAEMQIWGRAPGRELKRMERAPKMGVNLTLKMGWTNTTKRGKIRRPNRGSHGRD